MAHLAGLGSVELKPTATVVRGRDGTVIIERSELMSSQELENATATAKPAWLQDADETRESNQAVATPSSNPERLTQESEPFAPYKFNSKKSKWEQLSSFNDDSAIPPNTRIHMLTFNTWFSEHAWEARQDALIDLLSESVADIVCLQEVTGRFIRRLSRDKRIRSKYVMSDSDRGLSLGSYGVVILVRSDAEVPTPSLRWIELPSSMGRRALVAIFALQQETNPKYNTKGFMNAGPLLGAGAVGFLGGASGLGLEPATQQSEAASYSPQLAVATVHLESLNNRQLRAEQLRLIHSALVTYSAAVLTGDFNIPTSKEEGNRSEDRQVESLMPQYFDAWTSTHRVEADGFTFDTTANSMLTSYNFERERYDRVLARNCFCPSIEIVGDKPIHVGGQVYISDHFGLVFDLDI